MYHVRYSKLLAKGAGIEPDTYYYEIDVDSTADIPASMVWNNTIIAMGSIVRDVSTGDFYSPDSTGTWYNQDGGGAYTPPEPEPEPQPDPDPDPDPDPAPEVNNDETDPGTEGG